MYFWVLFKIFIRNFKNFKTYIIRLYYNIYNYFKLNISLSYEYNHVIVTLWVRNNIISIIIINDNSNFLKPIVVLVFFFVDKVYWSNQIVNIIVLFTLRYN